jgi:hypothetical protein
MVSAQVDARLGEVEPYQIKGFNASGILQEIFGQAKVEDPACAERDTPEF